MSAEPTPVVVVCGYYPPHLGGVEVVAQRLAQGLADRGRRVTVVTSAAGAPQGAGRSREPQSPVTVHRLRGWHLLHTPVLPAQLLVAWRAARGGVVHLHGGHITTDLVGWAVAALRRVPLVVHHHMDLPVSGRVGALVLPLYKRLVLGPLLRRADAVVTLTQGRSEQLVTTAGLDPARVVTIPNGVDEEYLRLGAQERRGRVAPDEDPGGTTVLRVLAVSRLVPQKDPLALLRALAATAAPVRARLVGGGELAAQLHALREELGLQDVDLPGVLVGQELLSAYADSDVFVSTASAEGMPLAVLQAMAAGLVVVARDTPELRELVGEAGVLLPDHSPAALATALEELSADPGRRRALGARARSRAEQFRWEHRVDSLERLLTRVASASATASPPGAQRAPACSGTP